MCEVDNINKTKRDGNDYTYVNDTVDLVLSKLPSPLFIPDPSSMHLVSPELQCGEEYSKNNNDGDEDDYYYNEEEMIGLITFHITLPSSALTLPCHRRRRRRLEFNCGDRSSGVLLPNEPSVQAIIVDEHQVHPLFFEQGFSLEALTGFQIWPGSRLVVEAFTCSKKNSNNNIDNKHNNTADIIMIVPSPMILPTVIAMPISNVSLSTVTSSSIVSKKECQETMLQTINRQQGGRGMNILEVGAGMGVVGICLAATGSNVIVTDLSVLVEHGIWPNMRRNSNNSIVSPSSSSISSSSISPNYEYPSFLERTIKSSASHDDVDDITNTDVDKYLVPIGTGWATAMVLDWFQPLSSQLSDNTVANIDIIIGCDCLFLKKLVDPFLTIISDIFDASIGSCKLVFTYERRHMMGLFISLEDLLEKIREEKEWTVECLSWRTIAIEGDGKHVIYLFQVSP